MLSGYTGKFGPSILPENILEQFNSSFFFFHLGELIGTNTVTVKTYFNFDFILSPNMT